MYTFVDNFSNIDFDIENVILETKFAENYLIPVLVDLVLNPFR